MILNETKKKHKRQSKCTVNERERRNLYGEQRRQRNRDGGLSFVQQQINLFRSRIHRTLPLNDNQ